MFIDIVERESCAVNSIVFYSRCKNAPYNTHFNNLNRNSTDIGGVPLRKKKIIIIIVRISH